MKRFLLTIASVMFVLVAGSLFAQEYNVTTFDYTGSIVPQRDNLWVNLNQAAWALDLYNGGAKVGDRVTILETKTADGTPYIMGYSVNARIYTGIFKEDSSWESAICVDYYDPNGYRIARLWQNRQNPWLFDIDRKFIHFWMPGKFEDYEISSGFGEREKPIAYYGGPDVEFHKGIDMLTDRGTPITSPVGSGNFSIGYSRTGGKYIYITHRESVYEKVDGQRRRVVRNFIIGILHLDGWPDATIQLQTYESRYQQWFIEMIQRDPEQILLYLLESNAERLPSAVWSSIPDDIQQVIGFSGWTGKSSGPHVHFEISIEAPNQDENEYVDPEEFLQHHLITRDFDSGQMSEFMSRFREILNAQSR